MLYWKIIYTFIAQSDNIAKDIARFKSFTAREIMELLKSKNVQTILDQLQFYKKAHKIDRAFQLWQEDSMNIPMD